MNVTAFLLMAVLSAVPDEGSRPAPVAVSVPDGPVLVGLARTAMHDYLKFRTPAAAQAIPPTARHLAQQQLGACVTLRQDGRIVGRCLRAGDSLPRNVITVALEAMRSPQLPDVVTPKILDSLTIEVEVLGVPRLIASPPSVGEMTDSRDALEQAKRELSAVIAPGLTGLLVTRGKKSGYVTPAQAYQESMGVDEMVRACLLQVPPGGADKVLPLNWSIFASKHFVGSPDGRVVWLSRGKIPIPDEAIDEQMLREAARNVGKFLLSRQDTSGAFRFNGQPVSTADQIRLAYALGLLAKEDKSFDTAMRRGLGPLRAALAGEKEKSPTAALRKLRAGLTPTSQPEALAQVLSLQAPADEYGGLAIGKHPPTTSVTAATVYGIPAAPNVKKWDILAARRFCYKMVCKPREAFYDSGEAGGVRGSPISPRLEPGACAAAIEALLAGGK